MGPCSYARWHRSADIFRAVFVICTLAQLQQVRSETVKNVVQQIYSEHKHK